MDKHRDSAAWGRLVGAMNRLRSAPPAAGTQHSWRTPLTSEQLNDLGRGVRVMDRPATELGRWWVSLLAAIADVAEGTAAAPDSAHLLHDIAQALLEFSAENGAGPRAVSGQDEGPLTALVTQPEVRLVADIARANQAAMPAPVGVAPVVARPASVPAATAALTPVTGALSATAERSPDADTSRAVTPAREASHPSAVAPRVIVAAPTTSAGADLEYPPSSKMPDGGPSSQAPARLSPRPVMPIPRVAQPVQPVLPLTGPMAVTSSQPGDPGRHLTSPTTRGATGTPDDWHPTPNPMRDGASA